MALTELEPPTSRPRGQYIRLLFSAGCGAVSKPQLNRGPDRLAMPAGMRTKNE